MKQTGVITEPGDLRELAREWIAEAITKHLHPDLGGSDRTVAGGVCAGGGSSGGSASESVVTPWQQAVSAPQPSAGFAAAGSVVTSLAGFGGAFLPHPPGGRTPTPAAFKYSPAVSRRTPVAF